MNSARPWRGAGPELIIAAITVGAAALAGGAVAGWPGMATALIAASGLAIVVLRGLAPRSAAQSIRRAKDKEVAGAITGYARRRFMVNTSLSSRAFYEADLRPILEHLLAARLSENHGINLYREPAAARAAFCRGRGDEALWSWIDPALAIPTMDRDMQRYGIPRRTLARIINRLEQL